MATTHPARPSTSGVTSGLRSWVAGRRLAVFFTLAFGLSWSFVLAWAEPEQRPTLRVGSPYWALVRPRCREADDGPCSGGGIWNRC